jgi:hypothetical protein
MKMIQEKLLKIQMELKAPKGQYNSFGKYKYRSCEDILEAVKPVLNKNGCTLHISDDVVNVGDKNYIKATATLIDIESGDTLTNTAFARESTEKKGMDDSQITGTASSYARKYCLNGLFLIDDTKDADTNEYHETVSEKITDTQLKSVRITLEKNPDKMSEEGICKYFNISKLEDMTADDLREFVSMINGGKKNEKK